MTETFGNKTVKLLQLNRVSRNYRGLWEVLKSFLKYING